MVTFSSVITGLRSNKQTREARDRSRKDLRTTLPSRAALRLETLEQRFLLSVDLPGMYLLDSDADYFPDQVIYLDFDGEENVTYNGPVAVGPFDVPTFRASDALTGQEPGIINSVLDSLRPIFSDTGIRFAVEKPSAFSSYSTVYIGGDDSPFSEYGSYLGLSEQVDVGNQIYGDNAFVFSDKLSSVLHDEGIATQLTGIITHEVGHLLGFVHEHHSTGNSMLSEVAVEDFTEPYQGGDQRSHFYSETVIPGTYSFEVNNVPNVNLAGTFYSAKWYRNDVFVDETNHPLDDPDYTFPFSTETTTKIEASIYRNPLFGSSTWMESHIWTVTATQPPSLDVNPHSLIFGSSSTQKSFQVRNDGGGSLSYSITDNRSWLSVNPRSGSSTGEWDTINVNVGRSGLQEGAYSGTVTVDPSVGSNEAVSVSMTVPDYIDVKRHSPTSSSVILDYNSNFTFKARGTDDNGDLDKAVWRLTGPETDSGTDNWFGTDDDRISQYSHRFDVSGDYMVSSTFHDDDGSTDSVSWSVHVNEPPKPDLVVPDIKMEGQTNLSTVIIHQGDSVTIDALSKNEGDVSSKRSVPYKWWWGFSRDDKHQRLNDAKDD